MIKSTLAACILLLTACNKPAEQYRLSILSFGTLIEVTVSGIELERANRAFDILEKDFQVMHSTWTSWQPGPVQQINHAISSGEAIEVDPMVLPLIEQSIELYQRSTGFYNPTIGHLIRLWRFDHADDSNIQPPEHHRVLQTVHANPSMKDITLAGSTLTSANKAVEFNFGAFAKGYGVQRAISKLKSLGIGNAIVNAGGDLCVSGNKNDKLWRIGVRHPRQSGTIAAIELNENECAFTSGDYERFYFHENKRYHHILDPDSGYPARDSISVTVVHNNGGLADAAATALFVAGKDRWQAIATSMGLEYVMLIDDHNTIHLSKAMQDRIELTNSQNYKINVVSLSP